MLWSTDGYYAVYYSEWLGTAGSLLLIMSVGYTVSRLSNRRQEGGSPCCDPLTSFPHAVIRPSGNPSALQSKPTNQRSIRSCSARRFLGSIGRVWGAARLADSGTAGASHLSASRVVAPSIPPLNSVGPGVRVGGTLPYECIGFTRPRKACMGSSQCWAGVR